MVDASMLAPLRKVDVKACPITLAQATAIARIIVARSGLADAFEWSLTAQTGRPRRVSWETLLVVLTVAGIQAVEMRYTEVAQVAAAMRREGLIETDVSYWQLWDNIDKFVCALDDPDGAVVTAHTHPLVVDRKTGEVADCPEGCEGGRRITRERFAALLLVASAFPPGTDILTTTFAIDSTDHETWAKRRSWDRLPDIDMSDGAEQPDDVDLHDSKSDDEWPKRGVDGRGQHTFDKEAREGYRSGKNLRRKDVFVGYDLHVVVPTPELGDSPLAHVALALATAPAGSSKSAAGLLAIDSLVGLANVSTIIADRGYSHLKAKSWAEQLTARSIDAVFDLHTDQLGVHPGPIDGTIWVDGGLFTAALPRHLRSLGQFTLTMTAKEKATLREKYNERLPYAFTYFGDADPVTGARRVRGPALRNLLRCPNDPRSMRLPKNRPMSSCPKPKTFTDGKKPKAPCGCSKTYTLKVDEHAWTKQIAPLWGTTEHAASYGRRVAVESFNADAKTHRGIRLQRGFTRVMGAAKNHMFIVFAFVGINVRTLRDWYTRRLLADPWMTAIGDTTDPDWATLNAHRSRKPRQLSLHERVATGTIPGVRLNPTRRRRNKPTATAAAGHGTATTPLRT